MVAEPGRVAQTAFLTTTNPMMPVNASDTDKINGILNALVAHGLMKFNDQGDAVSLPSLLLEPTIGVINDSVEKINARLTAMETLDIGGKLNAINAAMNNANDFILQVRKDGEQLQEFMKKCNEEFLSSNAAVQMMINDITTSKTNVENFVLAAAGD